LATLTDVEVMPVWSLMALAGIGDPPEPPPDVVVVDDELVELQATAVNATSTTVPSAAVRVLHDAAIKSPPCIRR
jgi:hypothetical protein